MKQTILLIGEIFQTKNEEIEKKFSTSFTVIKVPNYDEAIALFKSIHTVTKVIVIDISKDEDTKKINELKSINIVPEIIVCDSHNQSKKCINSMISGAFEYLLKPVAPQLLKNSILTALKTHNIMDSIKINTNSSLVNNVEKRINLAQEIMKTRRSQGKILTPEEMYIFFPPHDENKTNTSIKKISSHLKPNLLIIEDELIIRETLSIRLKNRNFEVDLAKTIEEGLKILKSKNNIDICLLDIGLPGKSGSDILPHLKETYPNVDVIMLTAYKDVDLIVDCFQKGASNYIVKPFEFTQLLTILSITYQQRLLHQVLPNLGHMFLSDELSSKVKLNILNDIAETRMKNNEDLKIEDIYNLFPETKKSNKNPSDSISKQIIDDGLMLYIEELAR